MDDGEMYFETDDQNLIKVNIVDDNDPNESDTALISKECYEKILSGQSVINKVYENGKLTYVVVDNNPDDASESIDTLNKVINNTNNLYSINQSSDSQHLYDDDTDSKENISMKTDSQSKAIDNIDVDNPNADSKLDQLKSEDDIPGDLYVITEYPHEDGYVVSITDPSGETIFERVGSIGEKIQIEIMGSAMEYEIEGLNGDGTYRQTNVYVQNSDTVKSTETLDGHQDQEMMPNDSIGSNVEQSDGGENEEEYAVIERTVIVDGLKRQSASLTDKHHTVLDKKNGMKGESVKLQFSEHIFEYLIQGPLETGEPIITKFKINRNDQDIVMRNQMDDHSDVEDPAADWGPSEMGKVEYAAIREEARKVAAALESTSELPAVQPYSEQLGPLGAYQDLVGLVERYKSRAEERKNDLFLLRKHSKIYVQARPSARRLTHFEMSTNEAAAQVCRYVPALLFHKKKLFECATTVIERVGLFPNESGRHVDNRGDDIDGGDSRNYGAVLNNVDDSSSNLASATGRPFPQIMNSASYISADIATNNLFGQGGFPNFGKRDLQLNASEENAILIAAEKQQQELYQYPSKPKSECNTVESQISEELPKLRAMLEGTPSEVEQAHEYMRETSAVNGRFMPSQRGRHQPLSPYDVAVNEAAYQLVKNNIGLLAYRKVLTDFAKKVVRASGYSFRHSAMGDKKEYNATNMWLYNQENIPELDLAPAIRILSDPLEEGPGLSLVSGTYVPPIKERSVKADSDDEEIYRPVEFKNQEVLGGTHLFCEADGNILNESAIYIHTGTDELKKVRILDFSNCAFTSIMPIDINYCYNLVELNLSNNSISYLPRCLFLPNLMKFNLKKNNFQTVPLLEQFPKLYSVELDDSVVRKLNKESLAFFCSELTYINDKKFDGYISDDFNVIFLEAKTSIETVVQSRWEEDLAMYFKKGVAKSDSQKVVETLVLSVRERKLINEEKYFNFKDLIARRVAESFLDSKITDDDEEEESKDQYNDDVEDDDTDDSRSEFNKIMKSRSQKKNEFDNQSVEKGQILLQDEPLDRLTNVVGQALRSGKTVVYSVMRTAARQPGGDLIPVGGCDSVQTTNNNYLLSASKKTTDITSTSDDKKEKSRELAKVKPGPASFKKRVYGIVESANEETDEDSSIRETLQKVIDEVMEKVESYSTTSKKKVGRPKRPILAPIVKNRDSNNRDSTTRESNNRENLEKQRQELFKLPSTIVESQKDWQSDIDSQDAMKDRRPASPVSQETIKKLSEIVRDCHEPIPPTKLRELLGVSTRGRPPRYIKDASDRTYMKHGMNIPDTPTKQLPLRSSLEDLYDSVMEELNMPNAPPQPQKLVNTRDSNRLKRFNVFGLTDNVNEVESMSDLEEPLDETKTLKDDYEYHPTPKRSKESSEEDSPTKSTGRTNTDNSDINSEASFLNDILKKKTQEQKEKHVQQRQLAKTTGVPVSLPVSKIFKPVQVCRGLMVNGRTPDYDPLHFIRCHARDNNPHDCNTKVWRCAFEPNPNSPYAETTTVVATCGGECVCLIDCRSGKVMKRFKSREEEFYTVAWTTVEMAAGHYINILAAAGKMKVIRLLHPEQLVCYAEMKGHEQEIACMTFHPRYPTILFSGDAMATILVWDIGIPTAPEYTTHYQLLTRLMCPRAHLNPVLNIVVMPSFDALLAGCEDGVFVWLFPEFRRHKSDEIKPPDFEIKIPTHQEPCFDGLARLSENTFIVKCVEEGEIFTVNFAQVMQHYKARKFDDQNRVIADVIGQLRWQITDEIYINVSAQLNLGSVTCGDNEGTIWLYDMSKEVKDENNTRKFKCKPAKILEWPECSVENNNEPDNKGQSNETNKNPIINCVEMSSDGNYLVAATDNNLVCIWHPSA